MEIQMFLPSELSEEQFTTFQKMSWEFWEKRIGITPEKLRNRDHDDDELAHYCKQARDFEYKFPRGR